MNENGTQEIHLSTLERLYRSMLRIRMVEEALAERYPEQEMRCPMHLYTGQEAIAVGVCDHLASTDAVFSNHRAHGHYLAKGGSLQGMIADMYGKESGCCGGRGGSMHLIDKSAGFMGSVPIVGGTVPLAVGMAFAFKTLKKNRVSVVFFGDGCFEEGVLHESMNYAVLKSLPVLFVCENNAYSVFTGLEERQPKRAIVDIARAHGLETVAGDGNDILHVHTAAAEAVRRAREESIPQFMEWQTFRWLGHVGYQNDDHLGYRKPGELAAWKTRCPVQRMESLLQGNHQWCSEQLESIRKEIDQEIETTFIDVKQCPAPDPRTAGKHVYGSTTGSV
ncbi:MAG: thiamine pyrophosphate-dependent dehydrogenase E1 component subunit alpha [Magnetococcales bacterium]|nr:thiamine pyrophosphate-dependent dehydrogenase E1 component subunit alpha [Magnetococcales bacterium]